MNYSTTDLYETKREIINFYRNITDGLSKPDEKFVMDMMYGLHYNQSVLLTDISRSLKESIKLRNTVERLSDRLASFRDSSLEIIKENYYRKVISYTDEHPLILLDNSEIIKKYGKKFENLCRVRDASSLKNDTYSGYYICEATIVTKNEMNRE